MFHIPAEAGPLTVTPVLRLLRPVPRHAYLLAVRPGPGLPEVRELADGAYRWSEGLAAPYRYLPELEGGQTHLLRAFPLPSGWDRVEVVVEPWRGAPAPVEEVFAPVVLQADLPRAGRCWLLDRQEAAA